METFGIVAGGHDEGRRSVGTDTEEPEKFGHRGDEEALDPLVELGQFVVERADPVGQRRQ